MPRLMRMRLPWLLPLALAACPPREDVTPEIRSARNAVAVAAANRAVSAVYAAAPFRNLPREFYGERVAVNFNAREACAG